MLQSVDSKSALSQQKLEKIFRYLSYKKVPFELVGKILEYYQYQMTSSVSLSQMVEFKELPKSMHTQATAPPRPKSLRQCRRSRRDATRRALR